MGDFVAAVPQTDLLAGLSLENKLTQQ